MKKSPVIFIGSLLFICLFSVTCSIENESEGEKESKTPVIQKYLTITGLDAFNGNYVVFYGKINWGSGIGGEVYGVIGCDAFSGNPVSNNFSLNGVKISGGTARIPIYAVSDYEENWGVFNGVVTKPIDDSETYPLEYSNIWPITVYINKNELMEYAYGYSLGDTVAAGITRIGVVEMSLDWTVNKNEFDEWFEW
jgi:hypothetical protein